MIRVPSCYFMVSVPKIQTMNHETHERNPKSKIRNPKSKGIILGCLGGMIGFVVSGLVHYNLGDQEVAMVFFLLMGISRSVQSSEFEVRAFLASNVDFEPRTLNCELRSANRT